MEELSQLVSIVSRFKPSQINVIDEDKADMANQLYKLIIDNRQITDDDASRFLYHKGVHGTFSKLKLRLKDKLLNTLFFIDLRGPKFSDYMKAGMECYRHLAIFFILRRFGANNLAVKLGDKLIKKSIRYDISEVSYLILSELCLFYSSESFNEKKYKYYAEILESEYEKVQRSHLMNSIYNNIFVRYSKSRSSHKDEITSEVSQHIPEINNILASSDSFWLNRKGYLILTLYYQILGDFENALSICKKAIHFFKDVAPIRSNVTIVNFYVQELSIHLNQKDFENGWKVALEAKTEIRYYTNDWHVISYLQFLLCTHTGHYEKAIELYLEVTLHDNYKKLPPFFVESWSIFEAYVHLVKDRTSLGESLSSFSINRYVNNIPKFSQDKRGNNISILIAHFIFLIKLKKHSEVIDRVDALNMYAHRYLREDATLRSNCFIKMLLSTVKADFNPIRTERYAHKYVEKLKATSPSISEQSTEIEIIPYEDLWDIILELLDKK